MVFNVALYSGIMFPVELRGLFTASQLMITDDCDRWNDLKRTGQSVYIRSGENCGWKFISKVREWNYLNYLEITNKMRPCIRIYYFNVSYCSTVSSDTSLIIRRSKTVFAAVCKTRGCKYSFWAPDDEWCVARNMLSNKKRWNNKF